MSPEIIKLAITTISSIFEKVVPVAKSIKRQNKAIDYAVMKIIPFLDNHQFEGFFKWISCLKIDSFVSLNFKSLEESIDYLSCGLNDELSYLGVNNESKIRINEVFVTAILKYAKQDKPIEYVAHIVDDISKKQNEILKLIKEENVSFDTYYSLEKEWKKQTKPSVGIDFFKIEENKIRDKLLNFVDKKISFYVSHYCVEEAVLMIVSTINELFPEKKMYVINNADTWKYFENKNLSNCIFIYRYKINGAITLNDILDNTCIYLLDIDEKPQNKKELIQFHKWYKNDLEEKFKKYGFSTEERVKIIKQTSGLFYQIKLYLWRGVFSLYDEFKEYKNIIKLLLVFPSFTERDMNYLSSFFDDIEMFKKGIKILTSGENPILIMPKSCFRVVNRVSDSSALWSKFGYLINEDEDYFYGKKDCLLNIELSDELKRGYLKSLSFYACVNKTRSQICIDKIVSDTIKKLTSSDTCSFNEVSLYEFAEPSPISVINFINDNKENLSLLFAESNEKNNILGFDSYTNITNALKRIVSYKEFAIKGFRLAAYFAGLEQLNNSNYSPKAKDILGLLYIPWINYSGLATQQRIKLGTEIYDSNKKLGDFILSSLSTINGPMMSIGYNIRPVNDDYNVSLDDFYLMKKYFFELIIKDASSINLTSYLKKIDQFDVDNETLEYIINRITDDIETLDDYHKYKIIENIRVFVYDCKYFQREFFKDKIEFLDKLTHLVENARYKNKLYEHLYIFAYSKYFFPLLHPIPFNADDDNDFLNNESIEKVLNKHLSFILDEKYDLDSLIKLVINELGNNNYAYDLFLSLKPEIDYDKRILNILIDNELPLVGFAYVINRKKFKGNKLVGAIKENNNPIFQSRILRFCNISTLLLDYIQTLSIDTQRNYWQTPMNLKFDNINIFNRVEKELFKFKSYSNWINLLDNNKLLIGISSAVNYLYDNVKIINKTLTSAMNDYHVSNILDECVDNDNDLGTLEKASLIEIAISEITRKKLKCLEKYCALSPKIFTDLFLSINNTRKANNEHYVFVYTLLNYKLIFCPGLYNGVFNPNIFDKWVKDFVSAAKDECEQKDIDYILGKLFGYSIDINKEIPIPDTICKYIKDNYSDHLAQGMKMAIYQPKGMELRTIGNGSDRFALSNKYLIASQNLSNAGYVKVAEVFECVSNWFYADGESEAEEAINGGY